MVPRYVRLREEATRIVVYFEFGPCLGFWASGLDFGPWISQILRPVLTVFSLGLPTAGVLRRGVGPLSEEGPQTLMYTCALLAGEALEPDAGHPPVSQSAPVHRSRRQTTQGQSLPEGGFTSRKSGVAANFEVIETSKIPVVQKAATHVSRRQSLVRLTKTRRVVVKKIPSAIAIGKNLKFSLHLAVGYEKP